MRPTATALILVVVAMLATGCAGTAAAPRSSACAVDPGYECQLEKTSKAL